jgi:hypothetical protein
MQFQQYLEVLNRVSSFTYMLGVRKRQFIYDLIVYNLCMGWAFLCSKCFLSETHVKGVEFFHFFDICPAHPDVSLTFI